MLVRGRVYLRSRELGIRDMPSPGSGRYARAASSAARSSPTPSRPKRASPASRPDRAASRPPAAARSGRSGRAPGRLPRTCWARSGAGRCRRCGRAPATRQGDPGRVDELQLLQVHDHRVASSRAPGLRSRRWRCWRGRARRAERRSSRSFVVWTTKVPSVMSRCSGRHLEAPASDRDRHTLSANASEQVDCGACFRRPGRARTNSNARDTLFASNRSPSDTKRANSLDTPGQ